MIADILFFTLIIGKKKIIERKPACFLFSNLFTCFLFSNLFRRLLDYYSFITVMMHTLVSTQNLLSSLFWTKFDASVINSCCCICFVCLTRTRSVPWAKREGFFSICVSLSFFTPVQSPWVPTGRTLITEWTFQKLQRQKRCPCDQTVQTKEIKEDSRNLNWQAF